MTHSFPHWLLAVLIVRVAWNTLRAELARTQDQA